MGGCLDGPERDLTGRKSYGGGDDMTTLPRSWKGRSLATFILSYRLKGAERTPIHVSDEKEGSVASVSRTRAHILTHS